MRFRPISILASATVLFLWGCPVGNAPITSDGSSSSTESTAASATSSPGNTDTHTDPIDPQSDVSWVQQVQVPPKAAAVRLLLTDAPVDADNVFVTFCGVRVARGGGTGSAQGGASEHVTADAGVAHDDSDLDVSGHAPADDGSASTDAGAPSVPAGDRSGTGGDGASTEEHSAADAGAPAPEPSDPGAGGWISISQECQTVDLLTLQNGLTQDIGISALPAGNYGQIRLMLKDASIVKSGVEQALMVPSGSESGVKIIGGFSIVEGQPATVTIDFDAGSSVHFAPGRGFIMNPVIKIVDVTTHDGSAATGAGSAQGGDSSGAAGSSGEVPESHDSGQPGAAQGAAGSSGDHHATEPATRGAHARGGQGSAGAGANAGE